MTDRKKKWKRKADSPLGSNNQNEAEEDNDNNGLLNGSIKSPQKQADPTNSSSPSANSISKSLKKDGESKEIAENDTNGHETNGNGSLKQTPPRGRSFNGMPYEGAGNDIPNSNADKNDALSKKSPNSKQNGDLTHENTTKLPLSARRQNRSPNTKEIFSQDQNRETESTQQNGSALTVNGNGHLPHPENSSEISKDLKPSEIKVELKSEPTNNVSNILNGNHISDSQVNEKGDDMEAMMLFESFVTIVQNENSQPLTGSDNSNEENNKLKKRKQLEEGNPRSKTSKLIADESLDDRPKRARKPTKMEDYDPDFDENGEIYSPSGNPGLATNISKKTPIKDSPRSGLEKIVSPRKTPTKRDSIEIPKKTPRKKRLQDNEDEDEYDKHTITSPGKFLENYDLGIDPARPKRQRKQLSNFKDEDLDEFEEFQEPPPRKKSLPKEKSKKIVSQNEELEEPIISNANDSPKSSPKDDRKKSTKANFGRINRPRLGEIPELEHKKVFCQNKTGIIIGNYFIFY